MGQQTKTDNHNPASKLLLRQHFLAKYHGEKPPRVLDCFQGSGLLWLKLSREFPLGSYWGVDLKPKKGRLKIDSSRILEQHGWEADVVDLDAYGSPWTHWRHLVRTFSGESVTVFLTIGMVKVGGGNFDRSVLDLTGCKFRELKLPKGLGVRLSDNAVAFAMADAVAAGLEPVEVQEAFPSARARYLGVHLRRKNAGVSQAPA
jgi:hypothetical protein